MTSSLFINTLQVNFESVIGMEHAGMVGMFKSLEDTGFHEFLEGTTYIFESAVTEFLSNARVIAGTVVSTVRGQKLVVTEEIFSGTFKLPTEGMPNFANIPNETIAEMRTKFSATKVPFKISGKKRELFFEYRLLHDIVAKSLCAKAGSFDSVTCENFKFMVAISAGISVNWGRILFHRLLRMVQNPRKQSQGYTVQISMLMELLVKADLGASTKLHAKKVLTNKQKVQPKVTKFLAGGTEQNVPNPKKRKHKGGEKKTQTKPFEEDSETNSCPLVKRRCRKKQASELSDSETTNSMTHTHFMKRRTQRQHQQSGWTGVTIATQPDPIPASITESEESLDGQFSQGGGDHFDETLEYNARTEHGGRKEQEHTTKKRDGFHHDSIPLVPNEGEGNIAEDEQLDTGSHEPTKIVSAQDVQTNADTSSVDRYCQLLITTTKYKVSAQLTIFEDWVHFRQEVRLKDISYFDSMVKIEEQLLEWGETGDITELSERRSFILYEIFELDLEKIYLAHLANFKTGITSVNHDFECIRRLHKELRMIAAAHRHYRELVGLPFITPDFSESDSLPKPFPALELDSLAGDGQDTTQTKGHQIEQSGNDDTAMTSYEHQDQEIEPT
ncbi:hypothetical protein F511_28876 [Dorcoceras hygrometricum]|uniref:Uncharacterized protein n=1 Tax=Dorcoceras hygrometricum TaxID=472368 RepID=A0A2Z7BG37_9LAMI|nr:hypothetical protein F511_28876 [Dorcoceras hygrometricum]